MTKVPKTNRGDGTPHWLVRRSKVTVDGGVAAVFGGVADVDGGMAAVSRGVASNSVRRELTSCVMSSGELSSVSSLFSHRCYANPLERRLPDSRSSLFPHAASLL